MFKINIKPTNYSSLLTAILILVATNLLYNFVKDQQQPAPQAATVIHPKTASIYSHASSFVDDIDHDGNCPVCDGLDPHCTYFQNQLKKAMRSYQIDLLRDGAEIWDGKRYVGFIPFNQTCTFNKIMLRDNE